MFVNLSSFFYSLRLEYYYYLEEQKTIKHDDIAGIHYFYLCRGFAFSLQSLLPLKDYITRRLQQERDQIEEDERLVRQYREDTERMRNQIEQLKTRCVAW